MTKLHLAPFQFERLTDTLTLGTFILLMKAKKSVIGTNVLFTLR